MSSLASSDKRDAAFAQKTFGCGQRYGRTLALIGLLTSPVLAQEGFGDHPVDSVLKALDLKTDVGPAPDFVETSRPKTEEDFVPVGQQHPTRPIKVKTHDELKAMESELDAARARQDKLAGRKPPPDKPAKAKAALDARTQPQN